MRSLFFRTLLAASTLGACSSPAAMTPTDGASPRVAASSPMHSALAPVAPPSAALADPSSVPTPPSDAPVSFLAVGDLLLTRRVARAVAQSGDASAPFRELAPLLASVDFTFANLESPLHDDTPLEGLRAHRFRVLNLANNHIMDGGLEGLLLTQSRLEGADVATTGVGADLQRAWRPALIEIRGVRIAFVGASYTSKNSSRLVRLPYVARIDHRAELGEALRAARAQADFVVAAMHAGTEYIRFPVAEQTRFAHAAIDQGADLVIGTHPHVVQRVERYHDRYVFYSLGNFIFDQERPPDVLSSAAVRITLRTSDKKLSRLEVIPLVNPTTLSPKQAPTDASRAVLLRMGLPKDRLIDLP